MEESSFPRHATLAAETLCGAFQIAVAERPHQEAHRAFGAVTRNAVEQRSEPLRVREAHRVVGLVHHQFLHHQLVLRHGRNA